MNNQNYQYLEDSINKQLNVNQSKNLLYINLEQIMDIDPSFLAALERLLDASPEEKLYEVSTEIVVYAA